MKKSFHDAYEFLCQFSNYFTTVKPALDAGVNPVVIKNESPKQTVVVVVNHRLAGNITSRPYDGLC